MIFQARPVAFGAAIDHPRARSTKTNLATLASRTNNPTIGATWQYYDAIRVYASGTSKRTRAQKSTHATRTGSRGAKGIALDCARERPELRQASHPFMHPRRAHISPQQSLTRSENTLVPRICFHVTRLGPGDANVDPCCTTVRPNAPEVGSCVTRA